MDERRFDLLTRRLAGSTTRRSMLREAAATLVAGGALANVAEADALLARLWSSTESRQQISANTSPDDNGATPLAVRTGVMNLVVVAPGEERAVGAASSLTSLPRNPSRTLFIVPRDP